MDPAIGDNVNEVLHGDLPFFRSVAGRISEAVGPAPVPIATLGAVRCGALPEAYWYYNTEDLHLPAKMTPGYRAVLDGAERVFDYSKANTERYARAEFCPIRLAPANGRQGLGELGTLLFAGYMTPRRRDVLSAISGAGGIEVELHDRLYGDELAAACREAGLVLSVGAHDAVTNDSFRVFPALEAGARMVVERCEEQWFNDAIRERATVVPYEDLVETCLSMLAP